MKKHLQNRINEVTEQIEQLTDPDWVAWGLIARAALYKESGDKESAIKDLTAAIDLPDIPMRKLEEALRARSWIRQCNDQYAAALMDIERIIHEPEMPRDRVGGARLQFHQIVSEAQEAGIDLLNIGSKQ